MFDDDDDEDFFEDSQYQTHYCCNDCGYEFYCCNDCGCEFWSDSVEAQCWNCGSEDIEEID